MQVLVAAVIVAVFAILRPRLSMNKPGKAQHIFESSTISLWPIRGVVGHEGPKYLAYFFTISCMFCSLT